MRTRSILAVVVTAAAVGAAGGWVARGVSANRQLEQVALAHQLEKVAFSADGLTALQAGHADTLQSLLWHGLESGVGAAHRQVAGGVRLPEEPATPNLIEGIRRAEAVAPASAATGLPAALADIRQALADRP